jgi:hypothetical protein
MQKRQCLWAFYNQRQRLANPAKGRFVTTDQQVSGSTPDGCTTIQAVCVSGLIASRFSAPFF